MTRGIQSLVFCGASAACGFAAVGLTLYAQSPAVSDAAALFGAIGFVAGLLCAALPIGLERWPARRPPALPAQVLAGLLRAVLARAAAERSAPRRPAADAALPSAAGAEPRAFASSAFHS